jgi:CMP-N-acetylneuraminic acid synthetase
MMAYPLVALVPMRHLSERVPAKNYRPFQGRPLYHHVVEMLQSCRSVERVVIDTDSAWIHEDAAHNFPDVLLLERAPELREGTASMNEVLLDDVRRVEAELYLQTHSTNPLLTSRSVERAIATFREGFPEHDSLFSVTRLQSRLWTAEGRPLNHDPDVLLRTQDLAPVLEENSCMYLFTGELLRRRRNRIGERPILFEMDALEAWDIDDETDFEVAEILFGRRRADEHGP